MKERQWEDDRQEADLVCHFLAALFDHWLVDSWRDRESGQSTGWRKLALAVRVGWWAMRPEPCLQPPTNRNKLAAAAVAAAVVVADCWSARAGPDSRNVPGPQTGSERSRRRCRCCLRSRWTDFERQTDRQTDRLRRQLRRLQRRQQQQPPRWSQQPTTGPWKSRLRLRWNEGHRRWWRQQQQPTRSYRNNEAALRRYRDCYCYHSRWSWPGFEPGSHVTRVNAQDCVSARRVKAACKRREERDIVHHIMTFFFGTGRDSGGKSFPFSSNFLTLAWNSVCCFKEKQKEKQPHGKEKYRKLDVRCFNKKNVSRFRLKRLLVGSRTEMTCLSWNIIFWKCKNYFACMREETNEWKPRITQDQLRQKELNKMNQIQEVQVGRISKGRAEKRKL